MAISLFIYFKIFVIFNYVPTEARCIRFPWNWELQEAVSCPAWILGNPAGSSGRAEVNAEPSLSEQKFYDCYDCFYGFFLNISLLYL